MDSQNATRTPLSSGTTNSEEIIMHGYVVGMMGSVYDELRCSLPPSLFHYTTLRGLMGILSSSRLWATDARFLNDRMEQRHGHEILGQMLKTAVVPCEANFGSELMGCVAETYRGGPMVTCFCEDGDLLSMWRGYDASAGFSIGFDAKYLRSHLSSPSRSGVETFGKVLYGDDFGQRVKQAFNVMCDEMRSKPMTDRNRATIKMHFAELLVLMKHPAFKAEREWRLVLPRPHLPRDIFFREGALGLTPYVETTLYQTDGLLPIKEIVIGPTPKSAATKDAVQLLLENTGYNGVAVRLSDVPYQS